MALPGLVINKTINGKKKYVARRNNPDGTRTDSGKFDLKREAEAELARMIAAAPVMKGGPTIESFMREELDLRTHVPSTARVYKRRAELLYRVAGDTNLVDVNPAVSRRIHRMICAAKKANDELYSRNSQRETWNLFVLYIRYAEEQRLLNPEHRPYLPVLSRSDWPQQVKRDYGRTLYAELAQQDAFLSVMAEKGSPADVMIAKITFDGGTRIGETLALAPGDYEPFSHTLRVTRSVTVDEDGKPLIGQTKTGKGRVVQLSEEVGRELRAFIREHGGKDLIFTENGKMLNPSTVRMRWRRWSTPLGFRLSPHSGRHTAGTNMAASGASPKAVSEQLGHSTATFSRYYEHLPADSLREMQEMRALWEAHKRANLRGQAPGDMDAVEAGEAPELGKHG